MNEYRIAQFLRKMANELESGDIYIENTTAEDVNEETERFDNVRLERTNTSYIDLHIKFVDYDDFIFHNEEFDLIKTQRRDVLRNDYS